METIMRSFFDPITPGQAPIVTALTGAAAYAHEAYEPASLLGLVASLGLGFLILCGVAHISLAFYLPAKRRAERLLQRLGKQSRGEQ